LEYITTTQLAEKYGRSNAAISHILHSKGIEPVDIGDHNCLLWEMAAEDVIRKSIEEETRQVTVKQYAEELKVSEEWLKEILKHFGITDNKLFRSKKVEEYVMKQKREQPKLTLEQMKMLHPLVKDERCFNINYWPATEPVCFKDL